MRPNCEIFRMFYYFKFHFFYKVQVQPSLSIFHQKCVKSTQYRLPKTKNAKSKQIVATNKNSYCSLFYSFSLSAAGKRVSSIAQRLCRCGVMCQNAYVLDTFIYSDYLWLFIRSNICDRSKALTENIFALEQNLLLSNNNYGIWIANSHRISMLRFGKP